MFTNASFKEGFQGYLNPEELVTAKDLASKVVNYYSDDHGWRRLEQAPHILSCTLFSMYRDAFWSSIALVKLCYLQNGSYFIGLPG